ncbi:glycosyltransferase [Clostridium sp.]|jgi:glycosyltransferase involved in cell wall biosynthesis|uniref:glycosyltransferase n=1 Tax=Clostridium sp. TaxID=1506 RepID=UPI003EEFE0A3
MYVMIVSRGYPTNKYKMNGIFEFDQAKALAKEGHKVVFAAVDVRSLRRWRKWGIEQQKIQGVNVYVINIPVGRLPKVILHKVTSIGLSILYKLILRKFGKPDVIHAHFTNLGYAALTLKNKINVPLVITEHSSSIIKPTIDDGLFNTAKEAYTHADAVIAVSPSLVNVIKSKFNINALYVPNIVDTNIFSYTVRDESKTFNFVSIGNLRIIKRMDLTVESFCSAFHDFPNVTLTIFGEGNERAKIEEIIKKHRMQNRVVLMGMCSREVISEKLKNSDCFVLASRSETFGVAYVESLATGVPVIATKCGGPETFVNKDNGLLIPVDGFNELVIAMKYMHQNIKTFDREKISDQIKSKFSPEQVSKKLVEVYKRVNDN